MKIALIPAGLALMAVALSAEPQRRAAPARAPRVSTDADCVADLGTGVKSARRFCDVLIGARIEDSISLKVPPRRGAARLLFDLHNRVAIPLAEISPAQTFSANTAVVAVVGPKGEIGRGVVASEFRTVADLFDRIGGGPGGGPKTVGPGPLTPVDITVPAGITLVGIVGVRLEVMTRLGKQTYDTPGRPIAIVSNLRVEYTPVR